MFSPQSVFVAEDDEGVAGYIIGPARYPAFNAKLEMQCGPALRERYPDVSGLPASPDERMRHLIHHPPRMPQRILDGYPAHLHINLLPRLRGQVSDGV